MEAEKIEQSIFTAWKQQHQGPEYDQSEGTEMLDLQNENVIYTRNLMTVIIQILLQLVRTLLSSHRKAKISPLACKYGPIMFSKNSPQARVADTRKKNIY